MPTAWNGLGYGQMSDGKARTVDPFSRGVDVPGGIGAAARARRVVEDELSRRLPRRTVEDVALLVTELIANGVRHGGADDDSFLYLMLEGQRDLLHVEVVNATDSHGAPARRAADLTGGGGIGLNLVDSLSSRWGVRRGANTAVWFELDC
jgi:anti-sigma regulatory factor (Ser/Thr protein kinase)